MATLMCWPSPPSPGSLDPQLPPVRVHNVGSLRDETDAVAFFEANLPGAAIVLVKLHGGVRSLPGLRRPRADHHA